MKRFVCVVTSHARRYERVQQVYALQLTRSAAFFAEVGIVVLDASCLRLFEAERRLEIDSTFLRAD